MRAAGRGRPGDRQIGYNTAMLVERMRIPIWREGRVALERASLLRDPLLRDPLQGEPLPRGAGIQRGDGAPVLMIPGFLAGDLSLTLMARWLRDLGYRPCRAGIRANVDCTERALVRLENQLERLAERHERPVRIVGHSRGGTMARVLAVRRPELVEGIVCLGSPMTDQLEVHPLVRAQLRAVALLGTLGVPGLFSFGCGSGCCAQATADTTAPFPDGVGFTSIYSRSDGIVAWRACLDPAAEQIEVQSSHVGMAVNGQVFKAVAAALAGAGRVTPMDQPVEAAA
jgi:pimeloyl-ACP methyl ester carboxylesterase